MLVPEHRKYNQYIIFRKSTKFHNLTFISKTNIKPHDISLLGLSVHILGPPKDRLSSNYTFITLVWYSHYDVLKEN